MSSRLFQEAREKRGLCYSIYAFSHSFRDAGVIGVYSGTAEEKAGEIAPLVAAEIEAMATGATEEEASRARAQLKASLLMGLESPHDLGEGQAGNGLVDDDAHGALGGVGAHVDDRLREALVAHSGQRDQELALEKALAFVHAMVTRGTHAGTLFMHDAGRKEV